MLKQSTNANIEFLQPQIAFKCQRATSCRPPVNPTSTLSENLTGNHNRAGCEHFKRRNFQQYRYTYFRILF